MADLLNDLIGENIQRLVLFFWIAFIMLIVFGVVWVKIFRK